MATEPTTSNPTLAEAVSVLANLISSGEFEKAEILACGALEQFPDNGAFLTLHGIALANLDKMGLAAARFRSAAEKGVQQARVWLSFIEQYGDQPRELRQIQLEVEGLRRSAHVDYPTEVTMETFAQCNAACNFCPYREMERKGSKMSDELIGKIISDLTAIPRSVPFHIAPFKVNEPFLDKRLFSICASINQQLPHAKLRIFSNGSAFTRSILEQFSRLSNVARFWISLNSHEASDYERIMQLPFEGTLSKLDLLHGLVREGLFRIPVAVSRVAESSQRDAAFTQFVRERYPLFETFLLKRFDWAGQVAVDALPPVPAIGCTRWFELSIMANGKVALCCQDGEGRHVIGDALRENVLDIYNRPEYRRLRVDGLTRLEVKAPCNTCIY